MNALADSSITSVGIFAIVTGNMGQLVRISFPVHRVREVLSVRCLGHRGATIVAHTSGRALDAWVLGPNAGYSCDASGSRVGSWCLNGAAVVDSLSSGRGMSVAVLN